MLSIFTTCPQAQQTSWPWYAVSVKADTACPYAPPAMRDIKAEDSPGRLELSDMDDIGARGVDREEGEDAPVLVEEAEEEELFAFFDWDFLDKPLPGVFFFFFLLDDDEAAFAADRPFEDWPDIFWLFFFTDFFAGVFISLYDFPHSFRREERRELGNERRTTAGTQAKWQLLNLPKLSSEDGCAYAASANGFPKVDSFSM